MKHEWEGDRAGRRRDELRERIILPDYARDPDVTILDGQPYLAHAIVVGQIQKLDQKIAAIQKLGVRDRVEARVKLERLADREIGKQRRLLRHVANEVAGHRVVRRAGRRAVDVNHTSGERGAAGEHLEKGGLAAARRAEELRGTDEKDRMRES
jgi:hypothetical protein